MLDAFEAEVIKEALENARGNVAAAVQVLSVSVHLLALKIDRPGIERPARIEAPLAEW